MIDNHNIFLVIRKVKLMLKKYKTTTTPIKGVSVDPFKVLVSTILSARSKDEITEKASDRLFRRVRGPGELASMDTSVIEELIYPVGFYRTKARNLKKLSKILIRNYNSRVPDTIDELVKLPGVGRKTANLVMILGFNKPGICVDTHVHRITNRWGYVHAKSPLQTEKVLRKKLPRKLWKRINGLLVKFGQTICKPVSPRCNECKLRNICQYGIKMKDGKHSVNLKNIPKQYK